MSDMTIDLEDMPSAYAQLFQRSALGVKRGQSAWVFGTYTRCGKELSRQERDPSTSEDMRLACIAGSTAPEAEVVFVEMYMPATAAILLSKLKVGGSRTVVVQFSTKQGVDRTAVLDPSSGEWLDCPKSALSQKSWVASAAVGKT